MSTEFYKNTVAFFFNGLVPTHKNRIYAEVMTNSGNSCYDIINNSGSNMLMFLDEYCKTKHTHPIEIYLEYYDDHRMKEYTEYSEKVAYNNIKLHFIKSYHCIGDKKKTLFVRLKNAFLRYSSAIWLCETGNGTSYGKRKKQKFISLNYFISCKNDLREGLDYRWSKVDYLTTSSLLHSQIISSSTGMRLSSCQITGFPRNDTLFKTDKQEVIKEWIRKKVGFNPDKIFVYVPTYRDYEKQASQERPLFGYECDDLQEFLKKTNSVLIYKLHPLQNVSIIASDNSMIKYENSYDYTLYDLLAVADCLITDYCSVQYDYILLDRPIIFNLYDLDVYVKDRGLSYEPYEMFCPGSHVTNFDEMKVAMENVCRGNDDYSEDRMRVRKLLHMYDDDNSCKRTTQSVVEFMGKGFM